MAHCARTGEILIICSHNSLATVAAAPDDVLRDHSKNEKAPEQVLAGSTFRAECPTCKWEWQTRIGHFVDTKPGCPKCTLAQRGIPSQPTLAEAQPTELTEWE